MSLNHPPIRSQWRSDTHLRPITIHRSPRLNTHRPMRRSDRWTTTPVCLISCHTTVLLWDQTEAASMRRWQHPDTPSCTRTVSGAEEERTAAGSSDPLLRPENWWETSPSPPVPPQSLWSKYLQKVRERHTDSRLVSNPTLPWGPFQSSPPHSRSLCLIQLIWPSSACKPVCVVFPFLRRFGWMKILKDFEASLMHAYFQVCLISEAF